MLRFPALLLLSAVLLSSCVGTPRRAGLTTPAPDFDPARFFVGQSEGRGVLRKVFARPNPFVVHGEGRIDPDGVLVLVQRLAPSVGKAKTRTWRLHAVGDGQWRGTLSDAISPVTAEVRGNLFHPRYTIKGGYHAEQWIFLQPGGDSALNRMSVTRLGMSLGRIEETIRRVGN